MVSIAGCVVVGPDYKPLSYQVQSQWRDTDITGFIVDGALNEAREEETVWWKAFGDADLDRLVEAARESNHDVRIGAQRLVSAWEKRGIAEIDRLPVVNLSGSAIVARRGPAFGQQQGTSHAYSADIDSRWEIDLFGGIARSIEAAQMDLETSETELQSVLSSISAEVALAYTDFRVGQRRLETAVDTLKLLEEALELARYRYSAGLSTELDVDQAIYTLEESRSRIPSIRASRESALNRLAVLISREPGSIDDMLTHDAAVPVLPARVVVDIPAHVIMKRPDIRKAERQIAAENARIGIAEAELYPSIQITGRFGLDASDIESMGSLRNRMMSTGPGISWRIFDWGALQANIRVRESAYQEAVLQYEKTVLLALEEGQNALADYAEEHRLNKHLQLALASARTAADLALAQYRSGTVDFRTVLDAQRSLFSFQDKLVVSQGSLVKNLIRFYKAIGAGC